MQEGSTALHHAADSGCSSAVKTLLLESKAQVDACNEVILKKQLSVDVCVDYPRCGCGGLIRVSPYDYGCMSELALYDPFRKWCQGGRQVRHRVAEGH